MIPVIVVSSDDGVQQVSDRQEGVLVVTVMAVMAVVVVVILVREREDWNR